MKVVLIGPGALGTLFAALLAKAGHAETWLLDHNSARCRLINRRGLIVSGLTSIKVRGKRIRSACGARKIGVSDLVIILVKSFDTEPAVRSARPCIGPRTCVLSLQNGLGNLSAIERSLRGRPIGGLLGGITAHGATLLGWGRVRHAGRGPTFIGADTPAQLRRAREIASLLGRAGIRSRVFRGTEMLIWSKLVLNSAMNPLGAALRVRNGELVRDQSARALLRSAAEESASVAKAAKIRLIFSEPADRAEQVCRATAGNFNSTLQDLLHGRKTEIQHINGPVVRRARALGVPVPINEAFLRAFTRAE